MLDQRGTILLQVIKRLLMVVKKNLLPIIQSAFMQEDRPISLHLYGAETQQLYHQQMIR